MNEEKEKYDDRNYGIVVDKRTSQKLFSVLFVTGLILTVTASAVLAEQESIDIRKLYNGENAFEHMETLVSFGPRVAGGDAEKEAAEYIASEMESFGLNVEVQEFPILYFENFGSILEVVDGPVLSPNTLQFSPSGEFTAEIVECGLGYPEDFPLVNNKIALIKRGEITFLEKTQNAASAGAKAAVIYNNEPDNFFGTLMEITDIPAVSISGTEGEALLELLDTETVAIFLKVDTTVELRSSQNVIGTLEGIDPEQGIVYIGGHYDSVSAGPGANDDASGTAGMLEAAHMLSTKGHSTRATLKFIAFGSEETGLDGSYNYVDANFDEVSTRGIGMINLDMIGVGDTLLIGNIYPENSNLADYTGEKASSLGMTWEPFTADFNSDHAYFEVAGVPAVFLNQYPDPYYHTSEDTPGKIDITALEENGELATAAMYDWAKNPEHRLKKADQLKKVHVHHDKVLAGE